MEKPDDEHSPLEAEAAKREEWRGNTHLDARDAPGHILPESESSFDSDDEGSPPAPRTIAPPD